MTPKYQTVQRQCVKVKEAEDVLKKQLTKEIVDRMPVLQVAIVSFGLLYH
jgi:hypothetical protein